MRGVYGYVKSGVSAWFEKRPATRLAGVHEVDQKKVRKRLSFGIAFRTRRGA